MLESKKRDQNRTSVKYKLGKRNSYGRDGRNWETDLMEKTDKKRLEKVDRKKIRRK